MLTMFTDVSNSKKLNLKVTSAVI